MKERKATARQSSFELLRILAMLFIVSAHVVSLVAYNYSSYGEKIVHAALMSGHGAGVNIFFLISGYYQCRAAFRPSRVYRTWLPAFQYSILIAAVFWGLGLSAFSVSELIKTICPVICGGWTYVSIFIVLMLLQPALNAVVHHLSQTDFRRTLIVLLLALSVLPSLTTVQTWYSYLGWACFLYILGGYIRLYCPQPMAHRRVFGFAAIAGLILIALSSIAIEYLGEAGIALPFGKWYFTYKNSPLAFVVAVSAFLWAKDSKWSSGIVNAVAGHTYGIYLIHINRLVTDWLYPHIESRMGGEIAIRTIAYTVMIFAVCLVIDTLRVLLLSGLRRAGGPS